MTKVVSPLSIYSYIKQVQYFLPLPSSVGCLLSQTKELDTLNWSLWWIVFEVRSLYRYIGFIPAQPGFQPWIDASNLCEDQSIIRRRVIEPLWERWFWWLPVYRLFFNADKMDFVLNLHAPWFLFLHRVFPFQRADVCTENMMVTTAKQYTDMRRNNRRHTSCKTDNITKMNNLQAGLVSLH